VAGQRPKQGWIYMINPYRVSLRCKMGHIHFYDLIEPGEVECQTAFCSLTINSSHVFRGAHPHIIWTSDEFETETNYSVKTFTTIPLTSKTTFTGLSTTYPIVSNSKNGLTAKSYALINQISTIDGNCLKKADGNWLERMGQLELRDKTEIEQRLKFSLGLSSSTTDDFIRSMTPELFKKAYGYLPDDLKMKALEDLIDGVD
jgi:mRNA interferase MazF